MFRTPNRKLTPILRVYLLRIPSYLATFIVLSIVTWIILYIVINGAKNLSWQLLFGPYSSSNPSLLAPTCVTLILIFCVSLITFPLGVAAAIYQTEFANTQGRLSKIFSRSIELLSGFPSIIFGLFGSLFFGQILGLGYSLISGILSMSTLTLPIIIKVSEEALRTANKDLKLGSLALGASKWHTIRKITLPQVKNGIFAGFMLCLGRIVGETAPLILTLGTAVNFPTNLKSSGRNLSLQMYVLTRDGGIPGIKAAFASAFILLLIASIINLIGSLMMGSQSSKKVKIKRSSHATMART